MSKVVHLLAIDVQNDFCDPKGSLFVAGADEDTKRLCKMVRRIGSKLDDIHLTMDSHPVNHIAHAHLWRDASGKPPNPFTIISANDVRNGVWSPKNPSWRNKFLNYVETLEKNKRYILCIWPDHCLISSWGHALVPDFELAVREWEIAQTAFANRVTKGSNPWTEHYSAVAADVPDPKDPSTQLNVALIKSLEEADMIAITGQALSHCVANTVRDIADNFSDQSFVQKLVLIRDTCSPVPAVPGVDFPAIAEGFVKEMVARGMQVTTSDKFLA